MTYLDITDDVLKEMTSLIVQAVNPRKEVLFGSHARGSARSDYDLDFRFHAQLAVEKSLKAWIAW
jgi:predicted nucleotidyltransferase